MKAAEDSDPGVRAAAVSALSGIDRLSPESAAVLLHALEDPSAQVRIAAAEGARIRPRLVRENQELFRKLLHDDDAQVRAAIAQAIGHTGEHGQWAIPQLTAMIEEKNPMVLSSAAYALAAITNSMGMTRQQEASAPGVPRRVERGFETRDQ
jgi:HEAT repeat protein